MTHDISADLFDNPFEIPVGIATAATATAAGELWEAVSALAQAGEPGAETDDHPFGKVERLKQNPLGPRNCPAHRDRDADIRGLSCHRLIGFVHWFLPALRLYAGRKLDQRIISGRLCKRRLRSGRHPACRRAEASR